MMYQVLEYYTPWKSILYCLLRFRFKSAYYIWIANRNLLKVPFDKDSYEVYYPDFPGVT